MYDCTRSREMKGVAGVGTKRDRQAARFFLGSMRPPPRRRPPPPLQARSSKSIPGSRTLTGNPLGSTSSQHRPSPASQSCQMFRIPLE